jgi:predicted Rossmann fold flavoprotein
LKTIAVIGAGAAGFFAAIKAAGDAGNIVTIFEKSNDVLSKVRISGGGRCNATHACFDVSELINFYPRGGRELRGAFHQFNTNHTIEWFEQRGVHLKTEEDGRMFPVTDSSSTIINCLMGELKRLKINLRTHTGISAIKKNETTFTLTVANKPAEEFDAVIITTGGYPSVKSYDWIKALGIQVIDPVPSLFTFNLPASPLKGLEGISVEDAQVSIPDTKFIYRGPFLVTHWGVSGPAVLKTSAYAARYIHERNYEFLCHINFLPQLSFEDVAEIFNEQKQNNAKRKVFTKPFAQIPLRLWERLCATAGITEALQYANLNKTQQQHLSTNLLKLPMHVKGKTTFKEEFVTCGGIDLKEVDMKTMQCKNIPGLFFAGEILNIDGVTGGFNFQAAWTTGFIAGSNFG